MSEPCRYYFYDLRGNFWWHGVNDWDWKSRSGPSIDKISDFIYQCQCAVCHGRQLYCNQRCDTMCTVWPILQSYGTGQSFIRSLTIDHHKSTAKWLATYKFIEDSHRHKRWDNTSMRRDASMYCDIFLRDVETTFLWKQYLTLQFPDIPYNNTNGVCTF